jgi:hypothetical protein
VVGWRSSREATGGDVARVSATSVTVRTPAAAAYPQMATVAAATATAVRAAFRTAAGHGLSSAEFTVYLMDPQIPMVIANKIASTDSGTRNNAAMQPTATSRAALAFHSTRYVAIDITSQCGEG